MSLHRINQLNYCKLPILEWPGGRTTEVIEVVSGRGRLVIGRIHDRSGYDDGWCYDSLAEALFALAKWNPMEQIEPEGWVKHISTGRRRINGDVQFEYLRYEEIEVRQRMEESRAVSIGDKGI
jgi:hypothetical protein